MSIYELHHTWPLLSGEFSLILEYYLPDILSQKKKKKVQNLKNKRKKIGSDFKPAYFVVLLVCYGSEELIQVSERLLTLLLQ